LSQFPPCHRCNIHKPSHADTLCESFSIRRLKRSDHTYL
jgi:hypothetical protein